MAQSRWPRLLRRGSVAARLLGLRVRIPSGAMSISCESCVLSGRDLCDGPNTRPEGTSVACLKCDHEDLIMSRPWSTGICCVMVK